LLIIDMLLNEQLDGLHIFEEIQRLFPAQKAIVVSGHAPTERAELAVKSGLLWLAKPYTMEALAQAVQQVLQGNAIIRDRGEFLVGPNVCGCLKPGRWMARLAGRTRGETCPSVVTTCERC
jgi:DNA-binding response OmpR family regulator